MAEDLKEAGGKVRLYVNAPLAAGIAVAPDEGQAHYLMHVMRAKAGDRVTLFNGRDGEWMAEIAEVSKRAIALRCLSRIAPQAEVPDLWLAFAPIKKTPSDYLVQKAAELGVRALLPVFTRRTIVTRINPERMAANAVEAAQQSGRLSVPRVAAGVSFERLLADWPKERTLYFCDEGGDALPLADAATGHVGPAAILTGPEGGFDPAERAALRALPFVVPVTLGPRILRADTAALAALAIWQSVAGDFSQQH
ncbi:MAG: 16S rRNA (uracil(1498)-N(3))-methyltransferase [Alphaproteobacteria bacterium 64-11]|nr:16S rRNA (uracil(1498)-N(3))-methyltransferase [Alphaproteobacteria bacterium]OJU09970.1 MAG: 16S rRNA (uracil(1498)-N(3))-methyltransferase [Alphaproteobacteria bacterium 64-11]